MANLSRLQILSAVQSKAIKFVSEGGAVSAIAGKYDLSKEIKKALEDAQPMKTETL